MTEKLDALRDLLAKVEAGKDISRWDANQPFQKSSTLDAVTDAARGSLDAAKALHEALLPGCHLSIYIPGKVTTEDARGCFHEGESDSPARAWLIAILKALISEEAR